MRSLLTRLRHLEKVRAAELGDGRLQVQIGYLKQLPPEYTGERHIITVGQLSNGHYQWEERPGAPRCWEEDCNPINVLRVILVQPKHAVHGNTV
jgi:hypothetical protein